MVVGVAKSQSVAYAALLLYRWLAAGASVYGSRAGLVVSGCFVGECNVMS